MRFVKSISLFFVYSVCLCVLSFWMGMNYNYDVLQEEDDNRFELYGQGNIIDDKTSECEEKRELETEKKPVSERKTESESEIEAVGTDCETLCADTEYVLEEVDILSGTVIETLSRMPQKYIGMNREQFLEAMSVYESFPPLAEQERGFVGLEVLGFSREKVTIRMNYKYIQSDGNFYLRVFNNEVYVYLEDRKTVYIETGILLNELPFDLQQKILNTLYIEKEEELYEFLETYSS